MLAKIGEPDPDRALAAIAADLTSEQQERGEALFQQSYPTPIFFAITIASVNQLSGINAISITSMTSIAGVFPVVAANSTAMPFFLFAVMMLVQFVVVLTLFPETKGVPLEETRPARRILAARPSPPPSR